MPAPAFGQLRKLSSAEVRELVEVGKTPRAREIERLQSYFDGTQYAGMADYMDLASGIPRLERAPCVNYPLVRSAVESNVSLCMGEGRFPRLLSQTSEDDTALDDVGLSDVESKLFDGFNAKLVEASALATLCEKAYRNSQSSRSAVLIGSYRDGVPQFDPIPSSYCTPTFAPNQRDVLALEIRYRYVDYYCDSIATAGEWWPVVREYRRVIDDRNDTTYAPKECWVPTDVDPSSVVAKGGKVAHGFGLCPVVWYARQRRSYALGSYDGVALHDGQMGELDALNYALSNRHLAAMYCGDPMLVGIGVDPDEDMGASGRQARPRDPDAPTDNGGWNRALRGDGAGGAIRKGPGEFWRTPNPDASIEYKTLAADALTAVSDHADDLANKLREALRYVWIDPDVLTGAGDVSGKTLEIIFAGQTRSVSQDRNDLERNLIRPLLSVMYRMLLARSDGVYVPGLAKVLPMLARFVVKLSDGTTAFLMPTLRLKWGKYFDPSDTDKQTRVATAAAALTSGTITIATAVEYQRDTFGIENVAQYVDALQAENAQKAADAAALFAANPPVAPTTSKAPPVAAAPARRAPPPKSKSKAA